MAVPVKYRRSAPFTISFNWEDVASGVGYVSYICTNTEDSTYLRSYKLLTQTLIAADPNGLISSTEPYFFYSPDFSKSSEMSGSAFVSGYFDYTSDAGTIAVQLDKESGTISADGEGSIQWTSPAENHDANTGSYQTVKSITINGYVHKVEWDMKTAGTAAYARMIYHYGGDNTATTSDVQESGATYATFEQDNPNQSFYVTRIEVQGKTTDQPLYIKDVNVYEENTSGLTTTSIASEIVTPSMSADQGFLLELPIDNVQISKGERIKMTLTKTGSDGSIVLDPTAETQTNETLKVQIPFTLQ